MKSVDNRREGVHLYAMSPNPSMALPREPSERQVEAAAMAWMTWQFPGRAWEDAVPEMKDKFRDGARRALLAAAIVELER